jgi:hypothetical protein
VAERPRAEPSASSVFAGAPRGAPSDRVYAGIGVRETPADALALIESIAAPLAADGWILRTGLSPGADQAFYRGARSAGGRVELYLPWPGFQPQARAAGEGEEVRELAAPSPAAHDLAARFHRAWDGRGWTQLTAGERALLARDGHQVLGADLKSPVAHVVCWTADGGVDGNDPRAQGSGQALRIAHDHGISIFNLARPAHARRLRERGLAA